MGFLKSLWYGLTSIFCAKKEDYNENTGRNQENEYIDFDANRQRALDEESRGNTIDTSPGANFMFSQVQHMEIHGGNFVQNNSARNNKRGFKLLRQRVAASAFHNSAQRVDPPRCHPDTRVDIMQRIFDWIVKSEDRQEWLLWLNGAAGAGKSAILQSIAERCVIESIAIASFFFFRSDPTRNTIDPLVATLVYQLVQAIPETLGDIVRTIEDNPLIFDQALEYQIQLLIIRPLLRLPTGLLTLFVIFVDGLDECNDQSQQSNLIKVFGDMSSRRNLPVIFLIASRRESQIEAAFEQIAAPEVLGTLSLDEIQASDDIRRYLQAKFKQIKATHLRRNFLPSDWPTTDVVEQIVAKSSGQFIYASVVIRYVSSPHAHPAVQLDVINGVRPRKPLADNPFAQLDALYQYIFEQVKDIDMVLDILALNILTINERYFGERLVQLDALFRLAPGELEVYLGDLAAVIKCEPRSKHEAEIRFLHASLRDFLLDKSRSDIYYIDLEKYREKLLCMFLEQSAPTLDAQSSSDLINTASSQEYWRLYAIRTLSESAKASERLQRALMHFDITFHSMKMVKVSDRSCNEILAHLQDMKFGDRGQAYNHVVDLFAAGFAKFWSSLHDDTKGDIRVHSLDLLPRIKAIQKQQK